MTSQFLKKKFEKCNMRSVNLEKTLEYLKIQEIVRSENLTAYYLCKGITLEVFLYPERYIIQAQSKTNHRISQNLMIICVKDILEECFWFSINVNVNLKFL